MLTKKTALISGVTGQDGSHLSDYLLSLNYKVYCLVRRTSSPNRSNILHLLNNPNFTLILGDLSDQHSITRALLISKPDLMYGLAAQSFVALSFKTPLYTGNVTGLGVLRCLEAIRQVDKNIRFYNAASCLPAGTKILVKGIVLRKRYGKILKFLTMLTKKILDINAGDLVLSMNIDTSKKLYCAVLNTGSRFAEDMYKISFSNGNYLLLSDNHPIYVINKGYVRTDEIIIGDKVIQKRYNGLSGIKMNGKTNLLIYGLKRAKLLNNKNSEALKKYYANGGQHPWKNKHIYDIYKDDLEKIEYLKLIYSKKGLLLKKYDICHLPKDHPISIKRYASISKAHKKLWSTPLHSKKMMKAFKKVYNKMLLKFDIFLNSILPNEYLYNGDGRHLIIGSKLPDFINLDRKKIIEFNGDYWHQDEQKLIDRILFFNKNGYLAIIVKQSEFVNNLEYVKQKILNFTFNPDVDIILVTEISKINSCKVYDILVLKNHNFFAKGILVHNSLMFGKMVLNPAKLTTPFYPRSPYGVAKLYGYWITRNYRLSYDIFACNGILFNHEGLRRSPLFVSQKIIHGLCDILLGKSKFILLGNIEAKRDWGYAGEYVKAMHLMLQQDKPDDYIVATGLTHSVKEFLQEAFGLVGLKYEDYVRISQLFFRPCLVDVLRGDASKIQSIGWLNNIKFKLLVKIMLLALMQKRKLLHGSI